MNTNQKKGKMLETSPAGLFNINFILLWQGQLVSHIGTQIYDIAMILWIKKATGMASLMGLLLMASHIPDIIMGPVGGTFSDRLPRKRIIVLSDFLSGLAVFIVTALIYVMPHQTNIILPCIFIVAVLLGGFLGFLGPAVTASIPALVPEKKLQAANSMMSASEEGSVFIGQAIGGILYSLFGAPLSFLINSLSYFFSAGTETFISLSETHVRGEKRKSIKDFIKDLKEGFTYVWSNKGLRNSAFIVAFQNFFIAPIIILLPFYVDIYLKAGPEWYGFLLASFSLGNIAGYVVAGIVHIPGKIRSQIIISSYILSFLLLFPVALIYNPFVVLVCIFTAGVLGGLTDVNILTILQLTTPNHLRGRLFGLLGTLSKILVPVGMGLAGFVADLLAKDIPLMFIGTGIIASFLFLLLSRNKDFKRILSYEYEGGND